MTDSRKVQLETSVDNSGAVQGFEGTKQAARDMAQAVGQAGQQAAKGLDVIAQGAKASGDAWTREEGRIRSAIQRSTLELQSMGKALSQKFEAKIDLQGLDSTKFAPYIAALKEAEQAQVRLASSQKADAFIGDLNSQIAALREQTKLQSLSADEALRYKAAQAGAAEAAEPLIQQLRALQAAQESVANAARTSAAAQKEAAATASKRDAFMDNLRSQADLVGKTRAEVLQLQAAQLGLAESAAPYIAQLQKAEQAQRALGTATKQDAFVEGLRIQAEAVGKTRSQLLEMQAAQLGVTDKVAPYIARLREAEQGQQKLGISAKQTAFALRQVPAQFTDIVVSLQAGQSPMQVLLQQGGQLKDLFGGVGNAIRGVASLVTPMVAAIGAGTLVIGGFALALAHVEKEARSLNTLQAQLGATGRGSVFSDADLKAYVRELAQAQGVTRETAALIVSELSKAHDIGGSLFRDLGKLANDYAKATGTSAKDAAAALAKAFSDPAQGAKDLDKALGTLTTTQILAIEKLVRQGNLLGAQRALYDAVAQSVKGLADNAATPLQRSINDLGNAWDRAMNRLDQSEGLRTVNRLLAATIGSVTWLIEHAPQLGGLGNIGMGLVPGALPGALGNAAGNGLRSAVGGLFPDSGPKFEGRGATGSFEVAPGANGGAPAAPSDDFIKRQLEVARGYQDEAGKIGDLKDKREALNKALAESNTLYGQNSEQSKRLREGVKGINEEIKNLAKRANAETQSIIDARLQGQIKAAQDALQQERETIAFQQKYLQGQYQAGELSVVDFYARKRQAIAAGVSVEIAELEKERAAVQAHLAKTVDPGKRQQDQERLGEIDRKEASLRLQGTREIQLSNQEQIASYKQLADQVASYRADLLQLEGDEVGAARVRAEQALLQSALSAKQTAGTPFAISQADLERQRVAIEQQLKLNAAKNASGIIDQALQLEEQRIANAQSRGAITTTEALEQSGQARRRVVAQLEEIVKAQEEVAASRPQDYQLQIDTARAREALEELKQQLDPLAEHFRTLFSDATGNLFADLANEPRNAKDAIKKFASGITKELNAEFGKDLANQLFSKEGILGKLPGSFGDLFRKGAPGAQKPLVDTSGVTQSLTALQTTGLQPATAALEQFTQALQAAAGAATPPAASPGTSAPVSAGDFARLDRGQPVAAAPTTGDFSRLDRRAGEAQAEEQRSAEQLATSNSAAASTVLQLAGAAARGGNALSLLPQIISLIQQAAASSAAGGGSGGGGGLAGLIGSVFGAGGSSAAVNMGTATGADLALFFGSGGYTGDVDPKQAAGIVHGKEFVFDAQATANIGRDTLERMHQAAHVDSANVAAQLIARVRGKRETGGPVDARGVYEINERGPEVLTVGGRDYLMMGSRSGQVHAAGADAKGAAKAGDTHVYHINVTATPQTTRQSSMQVATDIRRGLDRTRRNS